MTPGTDILMVVNDAGFFLSHRLAVASEAQQRGYRVHLATPPGDSVQRVVDLGFTHHPIPLVRGRAGPLGELRTVLALLRLYRRLRPRLVHHVTIKPILYGTLAARLAGVPAVVNAVSGLGFVFLERGRLASLRRRSVLASYRWLFSRPGTWIIVQNKDDYRYLLERRCIRERQSVLIRGSGVDLDDFACHAESNGPPTVILPARMLWDKGVGEFVEAARLLRQRGVEARFVLVGGVDEENPNAIDFGQLMQWAIARDIEWWGGRRRMARIYQGAHLVCLPSYREGLSKALLEAASCGRPVVTTDVPGCREAVIEDFNGHLVPPRDAPALAEALQDLILDPAKRARYGENARRLAEQQFSIEQVVARHMTLYEKVLANA